MTNVSCADLEIYALDALTKDEMIAFDAHLVICSPCSDALPELHDTASLLALSIPTEKPPARLKMKILGLTTMELEREAIKLTSVDSPPKNIIPIDRRKKAARVALAMTTVAASFILGTSIAFQQADVNKNPDAVRAAITPAATILDQVKAASDSSIINKKLSKGGEVSIAYSSSLNKAVFSSDNLSDLDPEKVYQVWFQEKDGKATPVGTVPDPQDTLMVLKGDVHTADALAVTIEDPGATKPTTIPIVFINL